MAKLGTKAVGEVVSLRINGTETDFIIVHQGLPSSDYDSSCNGTWLLMKDCYTSRAWDSSSNDYENSDIQSYLNNTFINLFDNKIKSEIKQVKIPYRQGDGKYGTDVSGANGLLTKVFLLSLAEVAPAAYANGVVLNYFSDDDDEKRKAYLNGSAVYWWLRSVYTENRDSAYRIYPSGSFYHTGVKNVYGVRPAIILPSELSIDGVGHSNINGAWKENTDGYVNIGGVWKKISETHINVGGVWKSIV